MRSSGGPITPDDPRCQPGAYISLDQSLYDVLRWVPTGPNSGALHVVNSKTEYPLSLGTSEVARAKLQRPAPELPAATPDEWAAAPVKQ